MAEWGDQQGPQSIEHPLNPRTSHSTAVPQFPHHREVVANRCTAPALRPPLSNAPISAGGTGPAPSPAPNCTECTGDTQQTPSMGWEPGGCAGDLVGKVLTLEGGSVERGRGNREEQRASPLSWRQHLRM